MIIHATMIEKNLTQTSTWERYIVLSHVISLLSIKERRQIFSTLKEIVEDEDVFFPHHGFSFCEFSVFHFICEKRKRKLSRSIKKIIDP